MSFEGIMMLSTICLYSVHKSACSQSGTLGHSCYQ